MAKAKKEKLEPLVSVITFNDLGVFKTAKEIAALPVNEISPAIEKQEQQYSKNLTIGGGATELLACLRCGDTLRAYVLPSSRRFELFCKDGSRSMPIKPAYVDQLATRGFLIGVPGGKKKVFTTGT